MPNAAPKLQARRQAEPSRAERWRGSARARGYDARWERYREHWLTAHRYCGQRDGGERVAEHSECALADRLVDATVVDHIVPHCGDPKLFWARENHQSLCQTCHNRKTATEDGGFGRTLVTASVTIVCGPPASGKSTYVQERTTRGDLIVDLDAIFMALSGLPQYDKPHVLMPFVVAARDAVLNRLRQPTDVKRAWVIAGLPTAAERTALARRLTAQVVVLNVKRDECVRRVQHDERRQQESRQWIGAIDRWFAASASGANMLGV